MQKSGLVKINLHSCPDHICQERPGRQICHSRIRTFRQHNPDINTASCRYLQSLVQCFRWQEIRCLNINILLRIRDGINFRLGEDSPRSHWSTCHNLHDIIASDVNGRIINLTIYNLLAYNIPIQQKAVCKP